jgi:rubredoxin
MSPTSSDQLCPECGEKKDHGYATIASPVGLSIFKDEQGRTHTHDPSYLKYAYRCANAHTWNHYTYFDCPVCGWVPPAALGRSRTVSSLVDVVRADHTARDAK